MPRRTEPTDSAAGLASSAPLKRRRPLSLLRALGAHSARERSFLLKEMMQVRGLMPLLMKQRNRQRWSAEDKAELLVHTKRLSQLSPYLVVVIMPGGFLMLPALAWWLDRRRNRNTRTSGG